MQKKNGSVSLRFIVSLVENKNCYASLSQRDVLLTLIANPAIEGSFFLTGGTALSAFYLHHRLSNDLYLFTLNPADMSEIDFWLRGYGRRKVPK